MIDREAWDQGWQDSYRQKNWGRLEDEINTPQQRLWVDLFLNSVPQNAKVLEIGCGGSQMLPFLARRRQVEAWGIDYSSAGISLAQKGFGVEGVEGNLVLGDALAPNSLPRSFFDVVYSVGVIEHFPPPSNINVMEKFAEYLRPGGIMITLIPNFAGIVGHLTRIFDRPLYDQHVPLDAEALDAVHQNAHLLVQQSAQYIGVFNFYVVNNQSLEAHVGRFNFRVIRKTTTTFQKLYIKLFPYRESRFFSPYVIGIYTKPTEH